MAKVTANLALARPRRCQKPGCSYDAPLNRHHMGHQAMWLGWVHLILGPKKAGVFVRRYQEFHAEDCVDICEHHHAEIHQLYDVQIQRSFKRWGVQISGCSPAQMNALMGSLITLCKKWLLSSTPGIDSSAFSKNRLTRRRPRA